jgi:hypothetical protein
MYDSHPLVLHGIQNGGFVFVDWEIGTFHFFWLLNVTSVRCRRRNRRFFLGFLLQKGMKQSMVEQCSRRRYADQRCRLIRTKYKGNRRFDDIRRQHIIPHWSGNLGVFQLGLWLFLKLLSYLLEHIQVFRPNQ